MKRTGNVLRRAMIVLFFTTVAAGCTHRGDETTKTDGSAGAGEPDVILAMGSDDQPGPVSLLIGPAFPGEPDEEGARNRREGERADARERHGVRVGTPGARREAWHSNPLLAARGIPGQHKGAVTSFWFSPDGKMLTSVGLDRWILEWRLTDGELLDGRRVAPLPPCTEPDDLTFIQDGRLLVGRACGDLGFFDASSGRANNRVTGDFFRCTFAPDGRTVAAANISGQYGIFHIPSGKLLHKLECTRKSTAMVAFSQDGHELACAQYESVAVVDSSGNLLKTLLPTQPEQIGRVAFSPDGTVLAGSSHRAGEADVIFLWDLARGSITHRLEGFKEIAALKFCPRSEELMAVHSDGSIELIGLKRPTRRMLRRPTGDLAVTQFSPDGSLLVTGDRKGNIALWRLTAP